MPPGPELGMVLAGVEREKLSGFDRVVVMKAHHRLVAHYQGEPYADMVAVTDAEQEALSPAPDMGGILDVAAGKVRAALTWTRRAAKYQLVFASMLVEDYPRVWKALPAGRIDVPKARVICNQTIHLDPELRSRVADTVLEQASVHSTGQLPARIGRLAVTVDPDTCEETLRAGCRGTTGGL